MSPDELALGLKGMFPIATLFGVTKLWMAVLADMGAIVLVTVNALRLLQFRTERGAAAQPTGPHL